MLVVLGVATAAYADEGGLDRPAISEGPTFDVVRALEGRKGLLDDKLAEDTGVWNTLKYGPPRLLIPVQEAFHVIPRWLFPPTFVADAAEGIVGRGFNVIDERNYPDPKSLEEDPGPWIGAANGLERLATGASKWVSEVTSFLGKPKAEAGETASTGVAPATSPVPTEERGQPGTASVAGVSAAVRAAVNDGSAQLANIDTLDSGDLDSSGAVNTLADGAVMPGPSDAAAVVVPQGTVGTTPGEATPTASNSSTASPSAPDNTVADSPTTGASTDFADAGKPPNSTAGAAAEGTLDAQQVDDVMEQLLAQGSGQLLARNLDAGRESAQKMQEAQAGFAAKVASIQSIVAKAGGTVPPSGSSESLSGATNAECNPPGLEARCEAQCGGLQAARASMSATYRVAACVENCDADGLPQSCPQVARYRAMAQQNMANAGSLGGSVPTLPH